MIIQNESKVIPNLSKNESSVNPLESVECFPDYFLQFSSRVLAGVLPLAGHIFEKMPPLRMLNDFPKFFAILNVNAVLGSTFDINGKSQRQRSQRPIWHGHVLNVNVNG